MRKLRLRISPVALTLGTKNLSHARLHVVLENNVEIGGEAPVAVAEEQSIRRVGDVPVEGCRVEMIGQVETADGRANRVFRTQLKVLGKSRVERDETREPAGIRHSHVALVRVGDGVGEPAAILDRKST